MFRVKVIALSLSLTTFLSLLAPFDVKAQRSVDPNMGHFYMARQQVQITDDGPVINNRTNAGGGAANGAAGALPGGGPALPAARWQSYAPPAEQPSLSTSLPKVNKRLPVKGPMPGAGGKSGKTAHLGTGKQSPFDAKKPSGNAVAEAGTKSATTSISGYTPYKKFAVEAPASINGGNNTNATVHGDVLHWARQRRNQ